MWIDLLDKPEDINVRLISSQFIMEKIFLWIKFCGIAMSFYGMIGMKRLD